MVRAAATGLVAASLALPAVAHPSPSTEAPCGTLVASASFTLGPPSPIASLDPLLTSNSFAEQNGIGMLYLPLLWLDSHFQVDRSKSLASAIAVNASHTRFTVTLRPWHWSDGTPVTAADALYSWQLIQALGPSYFAWNIGGVPNLVRSITAPDPRTLVVELTRTVNPDWFEKLGLGDFTPLPRQVWGKLSVQAQQAQQSEASFYRVVDGPFRLASLDLGRNAVFVPNARYDGPHAHLKRFVVDFLEGADPIERLRAGQLDVVNFPYDLWNAASHLAGAKRVELGPQGAISSIVLNFRNEDSSFLRDVRVRQAMARAIDQKQIINVVFHGHSLPQEGFVATGESFEIPPELRGGGGPLSFDPAAARRLLDAAGWRAGPNGSRTRDGRTLRLELLIPANAPGDILIAQLVQTDLEAIGFGISIKELEFNQLIARMMGARDGWDAVLLAWGSGNYPDGTQWFSPTSSGNFGGYDDPTMNRLLAKATSEAGDGPLFALERYAVEQQPMIFLPDGDPVLLARDDVGGLANVAGPSGELNAEDLAVDGVDGCEQPHA